MDRRILFTLTIALIFLSGCVKPVTLDDANATGPSKTSGNKTTIPHVEEPTSHKNQIGKISNASGTAVLPVNITDLVINGENATNEPENASGNSTIRNNSSKPAAPANPQNRIDASPGSTETKVIANWNGKTDTFTVPDTDHDAVAFDIAQKMGRGIKEIRAFLYFDGQAYLKPAELKKAQETFSAKASETFDVATIPIAVTKEDGFIRGVGCDLGMKYLRIDFVNPTDGDVNIFKPVLSGPKIHDALVVSLNRYPLKNLDCGKSLIIKPGGNLTCLKTGAIFLTTGPKKTVQNNATFETDKPDSIIATRPGYRENIEFRCEAPSGNQTGNESANT